VKLFIDTWGWLVLRDKREPLHRALKDFYQQIRDKNGMVYTSDYVLDETITLLFKRLSFESAKGSLVKIDEAIKEGYLLVEWITPERFEKAKEMRWKYQDKPKISFTDLTSMVVMEDLGIRDIITGDDHFEQVGMEFNKKP
jgi:predicted nucleic acid-binding protein